MSLNIKNERVHALARRAAEVTGKTQTGAIEEALRRLLAAYDQDPDLADRESRIRVVQRIAAEYRADETHANRGIADPNDLYDEVGLPR